MSPAKQNDADAEEFEHVKAQLADAIAAMQAEEAKRMARWKSVIAISTGVAVTWILTVLVVLIFTR